MQNPDSTQLTATNNALIATLAACTSFLIGYAFAIGYATVGSSLQGDRDSQNGQKTKVRHAVTPHEVILWSDFGR